MAAPLNVAFRNSSRLIFRSVKLNGHMKCLTCGSNSNLPKITYGKSQSACNVAPKFSYFRRSMSGSSALADRKCWKCGTATNTEQELFFCNCGVVQIVPSDMTFFQVMKCNETFNIDVQLLSELHKDLQRKLHPDRYSQKSKEERLLAEQQSAFINKAYNTLLKPLSRGLYLLELHNDPIEESNSDVDPEFLMEVMEVNEDIAEASTDMDALLKVENINSAKINLCLKEIYKTFKDNDIPSAKRHLIKLKYFTNIDDKLKEVYRTMMDKH